MAFPESPRVVYEKNTLEAVKCEIRFPTILKIDQSTPVEFQESVRREFPFFEARSSIKLPTGMPPDLARVVARVEQDVSLIGGKSYIFKTEDGAWTLALGKDRLSLTCSKYERWEELRDRMHRVMNSLAEVYQPSFFLHTCLRYKNSIRPKQLELDGASWSSLLQPWVSGPFDGNSAVAEEVETFQTKSVIRLPDSLGHVEASFSLGVHQPSGDQAFIIDSHVYNDARKEIDNVIPSLNALHHQARLFFRWCITDDLDRALRPGPA